MPIDGAIKERPAGFSSRSPFIGYGDFLWAPQGHAGVTTILGKQVKLQVKLRPLLVVSLFRMGVSHDALQRLKARRFRIRPLAHELDGKE